MTGYRKFAPWAIGMAGLAGCADSVPEASAPEMPISVGLAGLVTPEDESFEAQLRKELALGTPSGASAAVPAVIERPAPVLPPPTPSEPADPARVDSEAETGFIPASPGHPSIDLRADKGVAVPPSPAVPAPRAETEKEARARLLEELVRTLSTGGPGPDPLREAMPYLALDLIEAGIADGQLAAFGKLLSPPEAAAFDALRETLRELGRTTLEDGSAAPALDAEQVSRIFQEQAARLDRSKTLSIPTMALCTSVKSYGRYTAFPSSTFSQGRSHQAILYVAVDHFSQREAGTDDAAAGSSAAHALASAPRKDKRAPPSPSTAIHGLRAALAAAFSAKAAPKPADQDDSTDFVLELEQTVELFHDSDSIVVWKVPARVIRDVSHQRLRDCYLAQIIDLPANLSTGKFNLKVTVRDIHSGAAAESVLPIEIVADSPYAQAGP